MSISYARSATSPAEVAASVNRSVPLSKDTAALVDQMRRHYDDGCFACGRENPLGLHLDDFSLDEGLVSARFDPREEYRGAGTSLHGGVAATALDEMLVWAGILDLRVMSVTAKMDLKYRRPVQVTDPILVRARVDERRGRRLLNSGELLVDDQVCVEASGLYLITSDLAELGIL